ncbi:MAG: radical SAM protein [Lachnospiraceae bacterium]|nr:radical SAM protein [Lachnospiraceae bacterium]
MSALCTLCPRNCKADRSVGNAGFCGVPAEIYAARASLHKWEEPCLSGTNGSGTVFFTGCNLKCVYCQNHSIALGASPSVAENNASNPSADACDHSEVTPSAHTDKLIRTTAIKGRKLSAAELSQVFLRLQAAGAHNINLVTPSHYVPQIREALLAAKADGLTLPIVYNSSGYDLPETLRLLDGLVDIYMPDFKYLSPELASRYSHASDYPQVAKAALAEMFSQVGRPVFAKVASAPGTPDNATTARSTDQSAAAESRPGSDTSVTDPLLTRGVLVRYLLLPGCLKDGKAVLEYLYTTYGDDIIISIMNQYTPQPAQLTDYPELNRRVTTYEYNSLVNYALSLGIENAYIQEGKTAKESFIPDFDDGCFLIFP